MLPKDLFQESEKKPALKKTAEEVESDKEQAEDIPSPPSFLPETDRKKDRFAYLDSKKSRPETMPLQRDSVPLSDAAPIRRMDFRVEDGSTVDPIPATFSTEFSPFPVSPAGASTEYAPGFASELSEPASLTSSTTSQSVVRQPDASQRGFAELEAELQRLGARHTRFEEWGDGGGLYRFSCYVSSPAPYRYQKHFQAIDADPLRVMEAVLEKIRAWQTQSEPRS